MKIYAISDIHGCLRAFNTALEKIDISHDNDNILVLLGDYVHRGYDDFGVLEKITSLQNEFGKDRIITLMGNHEEMVINGEWEIDKPIKERPLDYEAESNKYKKWMSSLPLFYIVKDLCIFVHAGIDEEAGDYWQLGTPDHYYTSKWPVSIGKFLTNVVAGHIGTYSIARNPDFHDVYYDGASHYYIDGTVSETGKLPVLMVDTDTKQFYHLTDYGYMKVKKYDKYEY